MAVQSAIAEIQNVVGALTGIQDAPDYPPDQINAFPFAVCYARSGTHDIGPPELKTSLHNIVIEIHTSRQDLPFSVESVVGYIDSVPNALFAKLQSATPFTAFETWGATRYEFGPLDWGGVPTIGIRFTLEQVKIQTAIT
jgi:hypothetical protein